MPDTIGVAMVGLDHWYSAFMMLDEIVADSRMRLVAVAERNAAHLEEARQKYHPEIATLHAVEAIEAPGVELVFSFIDTASNPAVCLEALGRGIPTLSVKPPALTVADANRLAAAAEGSGVFWASFETYLRLTTRARQLKKLIRDGVIGQPLSFFQVAHGGLPQPWHGQQGDSWWLHADKVPGGAWLDHAIYAVDQVRWTLEREVELVSGFMAKRRHKDLALEDYGVAWLQLAGGFTAVMEDTWTADASTHFSRWIGTGGSLVAKADAFVIQKDGKEERIPFEDEGPSLMQQIAAAVRGEARIPMTPTCSVHNLAACLAVYESARSGRQVAPSAS